MNLLLHTVPVGGRAAVYSVFAKFRFPADNIPPTRGFNLNARLSVNCDDMVIEITA